MNFFKILTIAATLSIVASTADALKGVGTVDNLEFVADTTIPGISLCHNVEHIAVKRIPLTSESVGYAFARYQCDTDLFTPLTTAEVISYQSDGVIPADIPQVPKLSKAQFALNIVVIGGLLIFGIGGALWKFGYLRRSERALNNTGLLSTGLSGAKTARIPMSQKAQAHMMAAMCFVAQADGSIEGDEVIGIAKMVAKFTGEKINPTAVVDMIHYVADDTHESFLDTLGNGIKPRERLKVLEAAIAVAQSDRSVHPAEVAVINRIAAGLGLPTPDLTASSASTGNNMGLQPA